MPWRAMASSSTAMAFSVVALRERAPRGHEPRGIVQIAYEPPAVGQLLVVGVPHGVGVGALVPYPLAAPALFGLLLGDVRVPQYRMYGVVRNMHSGGSLYYALQGDGSAALPGDGREHRRMLPAPRQALPGPAQVPRVRYRSYRNAGVPPAEFLDPPRRDARVLGYRAGGRSPAALAYDPPDL